jgi:hypothetical protein
LPFSSYGLLSATAGTWPRTKAWYCYPRESGCGHVGVGLPPSN